ncbi:GntR family transcriptional regulator [Demequina sediminicola]|uniref:GntR family transcriptional regulator n=1 Tax=Demequina sediminicola TaxID=1095026 RepID=UPI000782ADA9|nr:GntR family transcriptional regulator [Demequina sediminicola]
MDDSRPLFQQIAEQLEAQILDGSLAEESAVPSINALAAFHRINPATALKGVTQLVDAGVLYKRRGVGMFVAPGARERLRAQRSEEFSAEYVRPLVVHARALGLSAAQVHIMIDKEMS